MKVLGLDISSKTGYALIDDGFLKDKGLLKSPIVINVLGENFAILDRASKMADLIFNLIKNNKPDYIYIEQTNAGKFRTSQKLLEFTHCVLLQHIVKHNLQDRVRYVDTSKWRSKLSIKLTKEERKHNKSVKEKKARGKITTKHLSVKWANKTYNLNLKIKDNDIADAIAIATFGYQTSQTFQAANFLKSDNIL